MNIDQSNRVQKIAIVGGGTAGWMTAAALSRFLKKQYIQISLIESEEIGPIGVGEATVPLLQYFNATLGIDEREFVKQTQGTFKLGIEFLNWTGDKSAYFHAFGDFGDDIEGIPTHQYWLKLYEAGVEGNLSDYSFSYQAGKAGRFVPPPTAVKPGWPSYKHAYHFDAAAYARLLRSYSEKNGVNRIEGRVTKVHQNSETGFVTRLDVENRAAIEADFFVDCSGFQGLLIQESMKSGYVDWQKWLPCDRAVVASSTKIENPRPYTTSTAQHAGWTWRIPLQNRTGNGYVYSSEYTTDDEATKVLQQHISGSALAEPRKLNFTAGYRKKMWNKNVVAIGLAGGFLEPLESTSIQLIQTSISRLIEFFPDNRFSSVVADEFNRQTISEFERIRDFIILHYHLNRRSEGELWSYVRNMSLPDTLKHKIDVFRATGKIPLLTEESYQEPSWVSIFIGSGILPDRYDPMVDNIDTQHLTKGMQARKNNISKIVASMPSHSDFIARTCAAPS